ncbi:MAG: hypothetical protein AAGJ35_03310, partial [Myxococcota bacterium]
PSLKKQNAALKDVYSGASQDCLQRLQHAFEHFFRRVQEKKQGANIKVGYPRFKKFGRYCSLNFPQVWMKQKKKTVEVIRLVHEAFAVPMPKNPKASEGRFFFTQNWSVEDFVASPSRLVMREEYHSEKDAKWTLVRLYCA